MINSAYSVSRLAASCRSSWIRSCLCCVSQEAAKVETPPISEPISAEVADNIAESIAQPSFLICQWQSRSRLAGSLRKSHLRLRGRTAGAATWDRCGAQSSHDDRNRCRTCFDVSTTTSSHCVGDLQTLTVLAFFSRGTNIANWDVAVYCAWAVRDSLVVGEIKRWLRNDAGSKDLGADTAFLVRP